MKRAHQGMVEDEDHVTSRPSENEGLQRVTKVSKRIHACTECQGRKIKCDLNKGDKSCTRCKKNGLNCVLNKSLQTLLEEETKSKNEMLQQVRSAVVEILSTLNLPPLQSFPFDGLETNLNFYSSSKDPSDAGHLTRLSEQLSPALTHDERRSTQMTRMAMTRENSSEPDQSGDIGNDVIVAAPMGSLWEVTKLRNLRSNPHGQSSMVSPLEDDFISRGMIRLGEAEELFDVFSRTLNHYLWGGIALIHEDLTSVRRSSSLLLAAILTVTAIHIPGKTSCFDICYSQFLSLVCDTMLDRYHTLDGLRGLCIGAFWLSDVSWKLSGHAVRIATEMSLHQSYARAMKGSAEHFERARLWYLLYVCDHHFSIAYGRPPVIHEDNTIIAHEKFLQLPGVAQSDLRLHSQVSIFIILTKMYNIFGPDIEQILDDTDLGQLRCFNVDLDNWRIKWQSQLAPNNYVQSYPSKGVNLHYHFAKLQLNSLALRGFRNMSPRDLLPDRREYANLAISSALTVLGIIIEEPDMRNAIVGVPLYMHTMITYAAVFLLKVQQKWESLRLNIDGFLIRDLVRQAISLLREAKAGERHLSYHIAAGLSKMLDRSIALEKPEQNTNSSASGGQEAMGQGYADNGFSGHFDVGFEVRNDYGPIALPGDMLSLYEEHYFPIGFFDVTAMSLNTQIGS